MPRPSNTDERRQQIVEGLMSVMATSGYGGATIPLIAQAAGLSTGLVHYHFDTKQSILIELIKYLATMVNTRAQIRAVKPAAKLEAYIDAHLAYGKGESTEAVACLIAIGAEAVTQPEIRSAYQDATRQQLTLLEKICEEVLHTEGRSVKGKREIALGIIAAIEGSYRLLVSAPDLIPRGFAAPTVRAMAFGLIAAQPRLK
ncbi:MAG: TetR family transcriptional regulator [Candidatus Obscuribacterales bacterium]|jgi:TetR/AcrR family transcriptional repressor of bet genes